MGCDVHMYVEMRGSFEVGQEPRWVHVQQALIFNAPEQSPYLMNEAYDEYLAEDLPLEEIETQPKLDTLGRSWYPGRNYDEFQMLAGVRGDTFPPMKPPTLHIPEDSCPQIRAAYESWGIDAHSATYYTLEELKMFEDAGYFEQTAKMMTYVLRDKVDHYLSNNEGAKVIEDEDDLFFPEKVKIEFEATYADHARYLTKSLIPDLYQLRWGMWNVFTDQPNPDEIRLVMWFDN